MVTLQYLEKLGIPYSEITEEQDPEGFRYAKKLLGYMQTPIVLVGKEHWSGFRPDKLDQLA